MWPVAAAVVGLSGGFALGRSIKRSAPEPEEAIPAAIPPAKALPEVVTPVPRAAPPRMTGHLHSQPEGAEVVRALDGEPLGVTPFELELPGADRGLKVLFLKKGFQPLEHELPASGEEVVRVTLTPNRPAAAASTGRAPVRTASAPAKAAPPPPAIAPPPPRTAPAKVASPAVRAPGSRTGAARGRGQSRQTTIDPFQ